MTEQNRKKENSREEIIDFVVAYVDDCDPKWQSKRDRYADTADKISKRYRSWDNLHYWFRCIAKYAPWVHRIFLLTDDQVPDWLNLDNEKIVTVDHRDFIPEEYLPVFSSHPIELNLHRIKELSEQFVYFNDDVFVTATVKPDLFFKNGLPCEYPAQSPYKAKDPSFSHILYNNIAAINQKYDRIEVLRKYKNLFYSPKNTDGMKKNLFYSFYQGKSFFGFENLHVSSCLLKSAIEACWKEFEYELDNTCRHRFRSEEDVNQYLFTYYLYVNGLFSPSDWKSITKSIQLNDSDSEKNNIAAAAEMIINQKKKVICLNDAAVNDFESTRHTINEALKTVVPDLCEFEKGYIASHEKMRSERAG